MRSKNASGYSKVVGGPCRPLLESPCWRWLIAVLTVTVFLPAAAHAGCEQVTATLAATVQGWTIRERPMRGTRSSPTPMPGWRWSQDP